MVSDVVCPWCWLGLRQLTAAVLRRPSVTSRVAFRPYQLDPSVPADGAPYQAYMRAKFGGAQGRETWNAMREHLEAAAETVGVRFAFDRLTVRPNTLNAHRLLRWAQGQGLGHAAKEALFYAYFVALEDIGDIAVLSDLAGRIGMDAELVRSLLKSDRDTDAVRHEERQARAMGVSGVPAFIFNGRTAVLGAQEADALAAAMDRAAKAVPHTD